jgi:hypothetical protein
MYEYETWYRPLREEHRLEMSENRVLTRIFGPKEKEIQEAGENFNTGASYFILFTKYY